jgi:hypothetical protein
VGLGGEVSEVASEAQLGARGDAEEARELSLPFAAAPLGRCSMQRRAPTAQVGGEAEALLVGEGAALRVDVEHQPVDFLPDLKKTLAATVKCGLVPMNSRRRP